MRRKKLNGKSKEGKAEPFSLCLLLSEYTTPIELLETVDIFIFFIPSLEHGCKIYIHLSNKKINKLPISSLKYLFL